MTEVYLGKPPEHIESWIKEHFKTSIWMPAVYTDNWVYSDSEDHHISLDNLSETGGGEGWSWVLDYQLGITYGTWIVNDAGEYTEPKNDDEKKNVVKVRGKIEDYSTGSLVYQYFTGHREYTPGHWEDGNGNWINGKWNDWTSVQDGYQVMGDGAQFGDPDSWYFVHDGQPSAQLSKKSNLPIWSGKFSNYSKIALAERTWINNIPVA